MTTFLLDQNVNQKSLADKCRQETRIAVRRFPREWRDYPGGFKDPQLLPMVMNGDQPLVTNDRNIAKEHLACIPPRNPGIIIVGFAKGTVRPIAKGDIEKLLTRFKARFPQWVFVSWSNSIVEITQQSVELWHVENDTLHHDLFVSYDDGEWPQKLELMLAKNANRRNLPAS